MASVRARVKPELLRWARESAGYDLATAGRKLNVAAGRVQEWENADRAPTVVQLRNMSRVYKRPMSVFYLPEVPTDFQVMHDFRRIPGDVAGHYSPELRFASRMSQQRRALALELLQEVGEEPPEFSLNAALEDDPDRVGATIRAALETPLEEQMRWRSPEEAFQGWRSKFEEYGVLVFQARHVDRSEMRAFSVSGRVLPAITLNAEDSANGKVFSLFHEFVHLMLQEGGLCDFDEASVRPPEEQRVEVFCNRVAGAALIPATRLLETMIVNNQESLTSWTDEDVENLSRRFVVSREVVLRRLLTLGRTTSGFYREKRRQYLEEYEDYRERIREVRRSRGGGGPSPSRLVVSNYGKGFVRLVLDTYHQDRITLSEVSEYLGVRVKHLPKIEAAVSRR